MRSRRFGGGRGLTPSSAVRIPVVGSERRGRTPGSHIGFSGCAESVPGLARARPGMRTDAQRQGLKRVVRARMAATGERYTAARAQVERRVAASAGSPDERPLLPDAVPLDAAFFQDWPRTRPYPEAARRDGRRARGRQESVGSACAGVSWSPLGADRCRRWCAWDPGPAGAGAGRCRLARSRAGGCGLRRGRCGSAAGPTGRQHSRCPPAHRRGERSGVAAPPGSLRPAARSARPAFRDTGPPAGQQLPDRPAPTPRR